jgi:MFS family permease
MNCYFRRTKLQSPSSDPIRSDNPIRPASLLAQRDFRRAYAAGAVSQVGDSFQFVALMWFAVSTGGPLGVIAVRIGNSLPSLVFGLHGGIAADRWNRRRVMMAADLVRAAILVPAAFAAMSGALRLWMLVPVGLVLSTATSYFTPAAGALLPALVGREQVQRANGLVSATNNLLSVAGWALAALLLSFVSVGSFFALNAASYVVSALLLSRVRAAPASSPDPDEPPSLLEGFSSLRVRPGLGAAVAMLGIGMTVMTGVWTVGVAELAHSSLGHGASGLSLLFAATSAGTIASAAFLSRRPVRRKVYSSCLCWSFLLPGYAGLALAESLPLALAGTFVVGAATGAAYVLVTTATQESIHETVLGRAMGIVFLGNVGTKPVGLALIAPLYLVLDPRLLFLVGGAVVLVCSLVAAGSVTTATRRALAAAV